MKNTDITLRPLSAHTGAEISGVDLSQDLPEQTCLEIRQAFNEWGVLFFRDQDLTPAQHAAFAGQFGEAQVDAPVSNMQGVDSEPAVKEVIREADDVRNIGGFWHMDQSFYPIPSVASILYARELPPVGGDTLFAHLGTAHDELSPGLRATLETLSAVHVRAHADSADINPAAGGLSAEFYAESRKKYAGIEATHPVIATHPESGRKVLYFSPVYCDRFDGWTRKESLPLMKYLTEIMTKPEHTCRFRWDEGSLAMWDNRAVVHYAADDYPGHRRLMHRVTVAGPWFTTTVAAA
ncbi:MAG: TauD/TfdA family dioxygenase [Rhodospirillaceae bacterium]|jgi:taurine dioxygenase|nr:TauD/TfdA family dioxygenase [Rhodospirillaceae bacterium]